MSEEYWPVGSIVTLNRAGRSYYALNITNPKRYEGYHIVGKHQGLEVVIPEKGKLAWMPARRVHWDLALGKDEDIYEDA